MLNGDLIVWGVWWKCSHSQYSSTISTYSVTFTNVNSTKQIWVDFKVTWLFLLFLTGFWLYCFIIKFSTICNILQYSLLWIVIYIPHEDMPFLSLPWWNLQKTKLNDVSRYWQGSHACHIQYTLYFKGTTHNLTGLQQVKLTEI